ncbi:hypothetical protein SAZ10_29520 [Mesorhizobium sp. BAC0120]|uniref:hypothetical protein n=1 Tax=Mesorhizobium sp. BAC0120 TaxID=3090670 RepID=UPI00298D51C9|nr:hypothetical protein [Mesorhizobium sp. BAC0120]MDW6025906.1 hypothetical protein [Mesorhizobium sp. BAC0120]
MAGYATDEAMKAYWDAAGHIYASDDPFAALRQRGSTYIDGTLCLPFPRLPLRNGNGRAPGH